jgi:single-strand DNA-binding protein
MNSLNIVGNLTGEYELKYTADNKPIGKFFIAVNTGYGDKKQTSFFNVVCFGNAAANHGNYIGKGSKVGITGSIKQNRWEAQDGTKRSAVEISAHQVDYLGTKKQGSQGSFDSAADEEPPF